MLQCIGKRFAGHTLVQCTNTSMVGSPGFPHIYLCPTCANYRAPKNGMQVEIPDLDKPNVPEPEASEMSFIDPLDLDGDEFEGLEEIDLD